MDKLKSEGEKLKGLHHKFKFKIRNFIKELKGMDEKMNELEIKCYMHGDDTCISHYDNFLLALLEVKRKMERETVFKRKNCWDMIPYSLRPKNEFEWDIKSSDTLNAYQKFYECSKTSNESIVKLFQDHFDLEKSMLKKLAEFNR